MPAGVVAITQCLAEELKDERILVNAVAPSIMDTRANRAAMPDAPHDRWPKVEEVARAVGTRGDVHAAELAARLDAIRTPAMPACLERNPRLRAFPVDGDRFLVAAFSDRQPLRLRRRLLRALDRFDGVTPTAQVLERIRSEDGFVVDVSTVLRLWRHRILQGGRCGDPGQDAGEPLR